MNAVVIRPLRKEHGAEFLSLVDALADFEGLKRPTRAAKARLLRDAFGRRKRFEAFLSFAGGTAAGYAIFFETYSSFRGLPTLYLEDPFVLPQYRKRGIGLKLFKRCLAEAKKRGCGRMEWVVLDWNTGAIRFYRKVRARQLKEWLVFRIDFRGPS